MAQVMAHRGASRAAAENTIAAFELAGTMQAHAVELDVRRTADGVLVVHHDASLADGRALCHVRADDLPPHVAHLDEALDACAGMWVNVEIKNDPGEVDFDSTDAIADATMAALLRREEPDRWLVSSFRIETIDRCRALDPAIATAWLTVEPPPGVETLVHERGHRALHPWYAAVDEALLQRCHALDIAVNVWTCDLPERMRELAGWGVDGICTNVPDVALAALGRSSERPRWINRA